MLPFLEKHFFFGGIFGQFLQTKNGVAALNVFALNLFAIESLTCS